MPCRDPRASKPLSRGRAGSGDRLPGSWRRPRTRRQLGSAHTLPRCRLGSRHISRARPCHLHAQPCSSHGTPTGAEVGGRCLGRFCSELFPDTGFHTLAALRRAVTRRRVGRSWAARRCPLACPETPVSSRGQQARRLSDPSRSRSSTEARPPLPRRDRQHGDAEFPPASVSSQAASGHRSTTRPSSRRHVGPTDPMAEHPQRTLASNEYCNLDDSHGLWGGADGATRGAWHKKVPDSSHIWQYIHKETPFWVAIKEKSLDLVRYYGLVFMVNALFSSYNLFHGRSGRFSSGFSMDCIQDPRQLAPSSRREPLRAPPARIVRPPPHWRNSQGRFRSSHGTKHPASTRRQSAPPRLVGQQHIKDYPRYFGPSAEQPKGDYYFSKLRQHGNMWKVCSSA